MTNSPNGIILLNENLEIQKINNVALRIVNMRNAADLMGEPVVRILDPSGFLRVMTSGKEIKDEKSAKAQKPAQRGSRKNAAEEKESPAERVATFPGGEKAFREYRRKNTRYPDECKELRLSGKAIVVVTIMPDGTHTGARISRSSGNRHMDAEALRVVGQMPGWTPAKDTKNGKEFTTHIPVNFRPGG
jgi:TonB family protein